MFSKTTILFCIFATLLGGQTDAKARLHRYGRHRQSQFKNLKRNADAEPIVQEIPFFNETSLSNQLSQNETAFLINITESFQTADNETAFLTNFTESFQTADNETAYFTNITESFQTSDNETAYFTNITDFSFQTSDNETSALSCNENTARIIGFDVTDVRTSSNGDNEVKVEVSVQVDNVSQNLEEAVREAVEKVGQETELFGSNSTEKNTHHVLSVVTATNADGETQAEIKIEVTYVIAEETVSNETAAFESITDSNNETGSLNGNIRIVDSETNLPIYEFPTRAVETSKDETTTESKSASLGTDATASVVVGGIACLALVLAIAAVAVVANRKQKSSPVQMEECSVLAIEAEEVEADVEAQASNVKGETEAQDDEAVGTTKEDSDEDVEVVEC